MSDFIAAPPAEPKPNLPHSRLGIASFIISLVVGVGILAVFLAAALLVARAGGNADDYPGQVAVGLAVMFLFACDVVAIGLGIAGSLEKTRRRVFAILGLAFSTLTVLGTIGLILLGLSMGNS